MLPHNAASLEASLRGVAGVDKVKVEGKTVRQFVQDVLAEQFALAKKTKLTWQKGQIGEPTDPKFRVGKLRKDKTWIGPTGRGKYYIQNMRVFLANGEVLKDLRSISDKPNKEMVKQPGGGVIEETYKSDRQMVEEALASYARQAAANDPNICPYCFQFSEPDRKKMTHHVFSKHPKEFNAEMASAGEGVEEDELPQTNMSEAPAEVPTVATE